MYQDVYFNQSNHSGMDLKNHFDGLEIGPFRYDENYLRSIHEKSTNYHKWDNDFFVQFVKDVIDGLRFITGSIICGLEDGICYLTNYVRGFNVHTSHLVCLI